jgi:hypothetical protein
MPIILAVWEADIRGLWFETSLGHGGDVQEFKKLHLNPRLGAVECAIIPSYMGG